MNDSEQEGPVDDELESRGMSRGKLSYDHTLPLEAVVAVEWYSRAQLEYLAEKIRKSQSITSLLLPIPKTVSTDRHEKKQNRSTPSYKFDLKSSTSKLPNKDLGKPLEIVSASVPRNSQNQTNREAAVEEMDVISTVNSIIDRVVSMGIEGSRSAPPIENRAPEQKLTEFSTASANAPKITDSTEVGGNHDRPRPSLQVPETDSEAENTKFNSTDAGESETRCEGNTEKLRAQRFHRKKQPIAMWQPAYFTLVELHEPKSEETQQPELSPIVKKQILLKLDQLVIITPKYDRNLVHRHFHDESTYGPDMVPAKLEPSKIREISSKVSLKSMTLLLPKREVTMNSAACEQYPIRNEEFGEEDLKLQKELSSLVFKEQRKEIPWDELFDGAHMLILNEAALGVKLYNKRAKLIKQKEDLLNQLSELQKSVQQRKRPLECSKRQSPKRKATEAARHVSATVRGQIVTVTPREPDEISTVQTMPLAPGTLFRVVRDNFHNDAVQAPRFHVIPAGSRTVENPQASYQWHSTPSGDSSANHQPVILNARSVNRSVDPTRPTVNASFQLRVLAETSSEPPVTEAQNISGQTTNVTISTMVDPLSNNRQTTSLASHTRSIQVSSGSTRPGRKVPQEAIQQLSLPPGFVWNDSDPSLGRVNSRLRQLVQGPPCASVALPARRATSLPRASNPGVVMVSPAQFSALQAQAQHGRPIHILREQAPATVIHIPRFSEEMTVLQPTTLTNVEAQTITALGSLHPRMASLQPNSRPVIINPSRNLRVVRPPSTIAPRFFTLRQAYVARPPGPAN